MEGLDILRLQMSWWVDTLDYYNSQWNLGLVLWYLIWKVPRLIKYLDGKNRGVREVICGSAFNLGISEIPGMVNMWGIYTTSKEANMYPKPIQDLSGWNVRSIACSTKARSNVNRSSSGLEHNFVCSGMDSGMWRCSDLLPAFALLWWAWKWRQEEELCSGELFISIFGFLCSQKLFLMICGANFAPYM